DGLTSALSHNLIDLRTKNIQIFVRYYISQ
ncbi:MAG: hypothetical protein ACI93V_001451, partial [Alteromonadaceae bacterium]